jgi:hypothetical protein
VVGEPAQVAPRAAGDVEHGGAAGQQRSPALYPGRRRECGVAQKQLQMKSATRTIISGRV